MARMRVTFDSNLYRRVTDPTRFPSDPAHDAFTKIHAAILDGTIQPFLCATIVTLEAIGRDVRGDYLADNRVKIETQERTGKSGAIEVQMLMGPDNSLHPGLPEILERWLEAALALGFKFLAAPRIGQPRPPILNDPDRFASLEQVDFELLGAVSRAIEARGLGIAQAKSIASGIARRVPHHHVQNVHWSALLREAADIHERRAIARAIAEWSDADAIAAHLAYHGDVFCTEDIGRSASGPSVLSPEARSWLGEDYGLVIRSATQLAAEVGVTKLKTAI